MTIRIYIRRRFLTYALVIVSVYVVGDLLTRALMPGSIWFLVAMVALCAATLFLIDEFVNIRCPRCSKRLASVLFQVWLGLPNQRCPHCQLDVDEQMPNI